MLKEWLKKVSIHVGHNEWRFVSVKRKYVQPKAVLVEYSYDTNVVAASLTCTVSVWRMGGPENGFNCNEYRLTDGPSVMRSAHPCDQ